MLKKYGLYIVYRMEIRVNGELIAVAFNDAEFFSSLCRLQVGTILIIRKIINVQSLATGFETNRLYNLV